MKEIQFKNYALARSTRDNIRKLKKKSGTYVNRNFQEFSLDSHLQIPASLLMIDLLHTMDRYRVEERVRMETGFTKTTDWCGHHWGVPSDVSDVSERYIDKSYWAFEFTSFPCPPVKAFQRLSENFPQVQFSHRYFGIGEKIAGEVTYSYGKPTKENRYEGHAYTELMSKLVKSGIFLSFDSGDQTVRCNENFRGETIDTNFYGEVVDDFSCIYGVNFSE